jgi:hypothetical protein
MYPHVTVEKKMEIAGANGAEHTILFRADCIVENDSIGSYEYWGIKGYDRRPDYLTFEDQVDALYLIHNKKKRKLKHASGVILGSIRDYIENNQREIFDKLRGDE